MSIRGIGDAFAFQRLLWLLVGTVIVPTVLLTLFGVMAIRNQQAAIEEQVRRQQDERLRFAAKMVFSQINEIDGQVRESVDSCESQCPPLRGTLQRWAWLETPPEPLKSWPLPEPAATTIWFNPPDGSSSIGILRAGRRTAAWRIDVLSLEAFLQEEGQQRYSDGVAFALRKSEVGPATQVEELIKRWEEDQFEATASLDRPLVGWEIVVSYPDNDPVRAILGHTRWLYPLGLVALVATVIAGTVVTLNSAAREIRLSRLQTDFVSNVSHELRTPLTSIHLFVETLQSGRLKDPERIQECLDVLSQETDRLSRMIERVLSWARMEAGRRTYAVEVVTVSELIDAALTAMRSQTLLGKADDFDVLLPPELSPIKADKDAIVESIVNLLQNAIKYTPPPRKIQIHAVQKGEYVGITVTDNGPGIEPSDRKRIFEKFYQADTMLSSPTGANRGSGLGLSIVRAVVAGHGGRIELHSSKSGSAFTLWLPKAVG